MPDHIVLDVTGVLCPMPLLKLKLALRDLAVGDCIELRASDSTSLQDIPAYCQLSGQTLLSSSEDNNVYTFRVQKAKP